MLDETLKDMIKEKSPDSAGDELARKQKTPWVREDILKLFEEKSTFYLNGFLFRIHKITKKGMEIRPVKGAPVHPLSPVDGKVKLSLPMPGGQCPLCGETVSKEKQ